METKHLITPEEFRENPRMHVLTVGDLKKRLENLPDDMPVMYQRIEDMYFETGGWKAVEMEWDYHEVSEYIPAWHAYKHKEGFFVIDAHY